MKNCDTPEPLRSARPWLIDTEVYITGRDEPLVAGQVHSRRDGDFPWLFFTASHGGGAPESPEKLHPDDRLVFVREEAVYRIEIRFEPARATPIGFAFVPEEPDEETES